MTGTGDEPVNHVLPAWDCLTGSMAATGLLAAERQRQRTGEGQHIKLALADVALATVGNLGFATELYVNDEDRSRHGNHLFGAFGKDFTTRDGRRVMVVGLSPRQWRSLVEATQIEEDLEPIAAEHGLDFSKEGDRFPVRNEIAALVANWVGQKTFAEVTNIFESHRVCWGPYQTVRELVENDEEFHGQKPDVQPD